MNISINLRIKYLLSLILAIILGFSINSFAGNVITIDEEMLDEPTVSNGSNAGTFNWNADGLLILDSYDGGSISAIGDLEVRINGNNKITCNDSEPYGISTQLGNLTIKGKGTLTIDATEKSKWSSAIYISVDNDEKSININDIDLIANGAYAGIEAHVEDYDGDGRIGSAILNVSNTNLALNATNAIYIGGKEAKVKFSNDKIIEPNTAKLTNLYFDENKVAVVIGANNEDIRLLESDYQANTNINALKQFVNENGIISEVNIKRQSYIGILVIILILLILAYIFFKGKLLKKGILFNKKSI